MLVLLLGVLHAVHIDYFIDDIRCHVASSMVSGLVTTVASVPVDITKTRLPICNDLVYFIQVVNKLLFVEFKT